MKDYQKESCNLIKILNKKVGNLKNTKMFIFIYSLDGKIIYKLIYFKKAY